LEADSGMAATVRGLCKSVHHKGLRPFAGGFIPIL
jgi:hypothetical protein